MESGVGWSDGVGPVGQAVGGAPGGGALGLRCAPGQARWRAEWLERRVGPKAETLTTFVQYQLEPSASKVP